MNSQNNEEQLILDYFKDFKGTVLDLGANDGKRLSNSYKVIQNGWKGVLVEPSPLAHSKLKQLYQDNPNVQLLKNGVSDESGKFQFNESGPHLKNGDIALLSSLVKTEVDKWRSSTQFKEIEIECLRFDQILELCNHKTFDLISIDIEGKDWDVLQQIDLDAIGCKMLIIEYNHDQQLKNKFIKYCDGFGMRLSHENYENVIFVR